MTPEEKARQQIDRMLDAAGWKIQDLHDLNLAAGPGVAVREFPLQSGEADYLLFVDRKAVGVVEAKPEGTTLSGVAEQSQKYLAGVPKNLPHVQEPLPFGYESTGAETFFRDLRDPDPRSRRVFSFHRPETLREWITQGNTLRARLRYPPPLITTGLRDCQTEAITNLERSLAEARPRALIQMATGSGKTYTAVSFIYRLIKFANAKRVLFLVDRNNLGRQTLREFQQYVTPDDGRKFTELYNVQHLASNHLDPVNRVVITTIQRLYSMLKGEPEFDAQAEELSLFDVNPASEKPKEVVYSPQIPIETFDFIVTDECHRSIYHLWRQVLDYYDAFIIGLTATPSKQTLGFFNQNLVMEYSHARAVADAVNVGYDVYRIKTDKGEHGGKVEAGFYVGKRDKLTRRTRWEALDEELEYTPSQLDRDVVAPNQIRAVLHAFRQNLFSEIFPGRRETPKTLIFAKDDSHAEDIVQIAREEFGKGNDFCKKITYKTTENVETLINSFRNSYNPRIAVTVDMISTGTDIKPLECLIFMRDVKSPVYFEQMKGRGTRTISETDFNGVTPDARDKTHFVIVDAIGVCESDKTDSRPLERKRSVPFDKLVQQVALGIRDEDTLTSLANRLARLDRAIGDKERERIARAAGNVGATGEGDVGANGEGRATGSPLHPLPVSPLPVIVNRLLDAVDPDVQIVRACKMFGTPEPTEEQVRQAAERLTEEACAVFDLPQFRNIVIEIKQQNDQVIDETPDQVTSAQFDDAARERAQRTVETFQRFIAEHKDELTALQIIYNMPYARRHLTYAEIKELAEAIQKPPYRLTSEQLWQAYEQLDRARVRGAGPQKLLTDLVALVRFAIGECEALEPFAATVDRRFEEWLATQSRTGRAFTPEQREWLGMLKEQIATSLAVGWEDFDYDPFYGKGGRIKAHNLFGTDLDGIMQELNGALVV
ncbi:MAG: type I restriction-modification enzyme R subunit C-terminal domain-containing protein [Anaerolineae bacterium]